VRETLGLNSENDTNVFFLVVLFVLGSRIKFEEENEDKALQ
jgi:hypothetical protein